MTPSDLALLPSTAPDKRIAYGPDSSQYGELKLPAGSGPHPVAVLIHGGCFKAAYATAQYLRQMGDALKSKGVGVVDLAPEQPRRLAGGGQRGLRALHAAHLQRPRGVGGGDLGQHLVRAVRLLARHRPLLEHEGQAGGREHRDGRGEGGAGHPGVERHVAARQRPK